jgi:hypothetical protein
MPAACSIRTKRTGWPASTSDLGVDDARPYLSLEAVSGQRNQANVATDWRTLAEYSIYLICGNLRASASHFPLLEPV